MHAQLPAETVWQDAEQTRLCSKQATAVVRWLDSSNLQKVMLVHVIHVQRATLSPMALPASA